MFRLSGDIDGLSSASGADALTTKRVSLVQSIDFMPGPAAWAKIAEKTHHGNILTRRTALTAGRTSARLTMGNRTATERAGRECEPARRAGGQSRRDGRGRVTLESR